MGGISVAAAIVVGLVSSFVQSLGLTIQRKSHVQESALPLLSQRRPIRRPLWLLGFTIYITSNIFSTIFQLDALPIVILAPLGAVSLIFNALLARLLLGDSFGRKAIIGTALVAGGAIMIAVFGVVQEGEHSLDDLLELSSRGAFLAFFSIVGALTILVIIAGHVAAWHVHRQMKTGRIALPGSETPPLSDHASNYASPREPPSIPFQPTFSAPQGQSRRWSLPASSPHCHTAELAAPEHPKHVVRFATGKSPSSSSLKIDLPTPFSETLEPSTSPLQQRTLTLIGLTFAAASGVLSGMSLVLAKAAVELLVITIGYVRTGKGANQFDRVQSWLLVAGLGIGAILQLVYLNYSLTFASPALICPLAFCFYNLSSIFDGLVFYDQFGRLQHYQIALVSVGVAILLLGVGVVSAVQPEGSGGVDVGTWVEEESVDCSRDQDENPNPPSPGSTRYTDEPDHISPTHAPAPTIPEHAVFSPAMSSPRSPLSPTRRRGPRYGTLIPEYVPQGAPTGFAIGLGVASPGFVLRSEGGCHGPTHRGRSRSEGQRGIEAIMAGHGGFDETDPDADGAGEAREGSGAHSRRRESWWGRIVSGGEGRGGLSLASKRGMVQVETFSID